MLKNNKGITLIALVITIIVLLILAGVSIAMLTGDNGILTQATSARNDTKAAEVADKINMALNGEYANILAEGYMSGMTSKDGTMSLAGDIADANGLDTTEFNIQPGTSMTAATVLTISGTEDYAGVTGSISYDSSTQKYSVHKATYPGESTTNSTNET